MLNLQNINSAKNNLLYYDPTTFSGHQNSFRFFLNRIKVNDFRHVRNLDFTFDHAISVISGTNKIGKTSLLLLIACSHENFMKFDSTKPETEFRRHTWRDVLNFTSHESATRSYSYELFWRVGNDNRTGEGKRAATKQSWTGLGKASADLTRVNARIREKQVRLIDLERLLPARNFSNSLIRKINSATQIRLHTDIEQAFNYIFELANPFDLDGVTIPTRQIVPNNCSWAYQGLNFATPSGACGWNNTTNGVTAYFDIRNNLLLSNANTFAAWTSGAIVLDNLYKTAKALNRYNVDGTVTAIPSGMFDYWQARSSTTPASLSSANSRRVKIYNTSWSSVTTYYSYKEGDIYNDLVSHNGAIWSCIRSNVNQTPAYGSNYWKRADICGKKLSSCASRFRAKPFTTAQPITIASTVENKDAILPFGGFPASRRLNTY